jgi:cathepsin B
MSRRQLTSKEREQIELQRDKNRELSQVHKAETARQRLELEALRRESQEKMAQLAKAKAPRRPLLQLSRSQALALGCLLAVLVLAGLNKATRPGPISSAVLNRLVLRSINSQARGFTVGSNAFFEGWTLEAVPRLFHVENAGGLPACAEPEAGAALPGRYDSRRRFKACLAPAQDQGNCSSSHALAVAGMLSDRYCIASGGKRRFDASAQHLLACLSEAPCAGGDLTAAARRVAETGLVNRVCAPEASEPVAACQEERLGSCPRLRFAAVCAPSGAAQIKRQILRHGPVASLLQPTVELLAYRAGNYDGARTRPLPGAQAVKVVGWDTDAAGREIWLVENSWGASWGRKGLARVRVGSDALLERSAVAGVPAEEPASALA